MANDVTRIEVECRTIDGEIYLRAADVSAGLMKRADSFREYQQRYPDWDRDYQAMIDELEDTAIWISASCIAHATDYPGDSNLEGSNDVE